MSTTSLVPGQSAASSGVQRLLNGATVRQICPPGHCELKPVQRHRPETFSGALAHPVVTATDSHSSAGSQASPQPPQLASSVEMSTQLPPQQRSDWVPPHELPSESAP